MTTMELDTDIVYGLWSDHDDTSGKVIQDYVQKNSNMEIVKVDGKQNLMDIHRNTKDSVERYLVILSKYLTDDHVVLVYLTQVLYRLHKNQHLNLILVNIDPEEPIPINLESLNIITAPELKEPQLYEILNSLKVPKIIKDVLPIGNVGVGLAWSYFYGYLNLILPRSFDHTDQIWIPGLKERILESTFYKENEDRIFKKFIILLPRSCQTPATFQDVDPRFASAGPLDGGFKKSRAGQPKRQYNIFVHKMKGNDNQDYFFCAEFATPLLAMQKMLEDPMCAMDEEEMNKQMVLFLHTLMSILNHNDNKACHYLTYILDYDDEDETYNLYDELLRIIIEDVNTPLQESRSSSESTESSSSPSRFEHGQVAYICERDDLFMQAVKEFLSDLNLDIFLEDPLHFLSIQELLEYKATSVDLNLRKIFIILYGDSANVELCINKLVLDKDTFHRTTFILEYAPDVPIPKWLEENGADYINARQDTEIWRRIMGSLCGTLTVEETGNMYLQCSVGEKCLSQSDRLPVGNVAEGLAWSYYHNYLTLIASSIPERIRNSKHFTTGRMAKKMLILLPYSCFSYPTLKEADEAIESVENLEPLRISISGKSRIYNTGVHRIQHGGNEYYACVEYCTPVLVMYEMEAEGKAGLTKRAKEAQLAFFYETLKRILEHPSTDECKDAFHLICYDDKDPENTLSAVIIKEINEIN